MNPQIRTWIKSFLTAAPPRSKSLVITIFGDSISPHGGSVWLGSLIDLLAPFGVNERLVRSSVFRLAEEDWLEATRQGRRSEYHLTASGASRFEQAHRKIYSRPSSDWDGEWTVLFAGPGQIPGDRRVQLRRELLWEGFRLLGPMTFARPGGDPVALHEVLDRAEVRKLVITCSVRDADPVFGRPLRSMVAENWDLHSVENGYRRFLSRFSQLAELLQKTAALEPEPAFVVRTLLIHAFRRVLLHDPLLPAELLPRDWLGVEAYELCRSIYRLASGSAEQHLLDVLQREGTETTGPADFFYERFGSVLRSEVGQAPGLRRALSPPPEQAD